MGFIRVTFVLRVRDTDLPPFFPVAPLLPQPQLKQTSPPKTKNQQHSTQSFSFLSSELLQPYGYSPTTSGLLGAALLLSGIVAAVVTAPVFDRVLTHHLGVAARVTSPVVSAAWFALIWGGTSLLSFAFEL